MEKRANEAVLHRQFDAENVRGEQPFRLHAGIGLDHADPEAALLLVAEEPVQGGVETVLDAIGHVDVHAGALPRLKDGLLYTIPRREKPSSPRGGEKGFPAAALVFALLEA